MATAAALNPPLVSVIIPCYNQGRFLSEAVQSIIQQQYPATEIIVVDDGSTDNTREIAATCAGVKYIFQANQGLSAARNTGIQNCSGAYLVFLDADDWLLPGAIATNLAYLRQNEQLAFVSGGHVKVFVEENIRQEEIQEVTSDHYRQLLQGNYIGMHATVMYRQWVLAEFKYDVTLPLCEDYDIYLKIANKYPVQHHTGKIAAYRLHSANMSGNVPAMLAAVLRVLARQRNNLRTPADWQAYRRGRKVWKNYYCQELYRKLRAKKTAVSFASLFILLKYKPSLLLKYFLSRRAFKLKTYVNTPKAISP